MNFFKKRSVQKMPEIANCTITENGSGYVIRFRLLELWGQLTA
jgi:hypothetical protein